VAPKLHGTTQMAPTPTGTSTGIDAFADVPVRLEARIACRAATLDQLARLETAGALTLDKPAGETIDVFVGDLCLATAEVIVIEDRLALRITDLRLPGGSKA